jgi:hypothetical protein
MTANSSNENARRRDELVRRLRTGRTWVDQSGDHYEEPSDLQIEAANEIEALRQSNRDLAHLLKYAAEHSSLAPLMNDSWRQDSLSALKEMP